MTVSQPTTDVQSLWHIKIHKIQIKQSKSKDASMNSDRWKEIYCISKSCSQSPAMAHKLHLSVAQALKMYFKKGYKAPPCKATNENCECYKKRELP